MSECTHVIIPDFGGVATNTLFEAHSATEAALDLTTGSLTRKSPFDLETDPLCRNTPDGTINERDNWLARSKEVGKARS